MDTGFAGLVDRLTDVLQRPLLAGTLVVLCLLALLSYRPPADPDVFARVAVGRLVEVNGGVVDQDPFSFTPKLDRWIDHEWLSGVVFYRVSQMGGELGLLALDLGMMLLTLALLVRAAREHGGKERVNLTWLLLVMAPAFGSWVSVVRSGVFTFLLLAWTLLLLVRWRRNAPAWIWGIPPTFVLWANLHGGFVAVLGMLGAAALLVTVAEGKRSISLWGCVLLAGLLTLLNPYGLEFWRYVLQAVTMERPRIVEWRSLPPWSLRGVLALGFASVLVVGDRRAERRLPPEGWAFVAATLLAAFSAQRMLNLLYPVLAVYGGPAATSVGHSLASRLRLWAIALRRVATIAVLPSVIVLSLLVARNLGQVLREGINYDDFPVAAVQWLERHGEGGRLLVHFNHGSFALWRLYPLYRVSLDGRYEEVYPPSTVEAGFRAVDPHEEGHEAALRELDPDYILLPVSAWASDFEPPWRPVYDDGRFAVLSRREPRNLDRGVDRPMWAPGF